MTVVQLNNEVPELSIVNEDGSTIFSDDTIEYIVPLYQRAYAWETKERLQLIDDICDCDADEYFLGSLVVNKRIDKDKNIYEVVDGQQRLTTLYILLKCLDYDVKNTLTFECRGKSNNSLRKLETLENEDEVERNILLAKKDFLTEFKKSKIVDKLKENLKKVKLFRIEVPPKTDLNRYFEIMNTRGEQLEQHDILKANIMKLIKNHEKHQLFAEIWDACSDMNGYVQMNFSSINLREKIFGLKWDCEPYHDFFNSLTVDKSEEEKAKNKIAYKTMDIKSIVTGNEPSVKNEQEAIDGNKYRFESIIDFPFFLLHVLRLFVKKQNLEFYDENGVKHSRDPLDKLLDDKKLLSDYENVYQNAFKDGEKYDGEAFAIEFIEFLLQYRFLFDKYIIKREYVNSNENGQWSLKTLEANNKKPSYINTNFDEGSTYGHSNVLMLQSCYRVSYTSPKVMHWITEALDLCGDNNLSWRDYETKLENIGKKAVYENFLKNQEFENGVLTQHIVFNYLDYLLWRDTWKNNKRVYDDFIFEFRNSVEHWYPQTPSADSIAKWEKVDKFGNLCIIQRQINSKFSNLDPFSKKNTYSGIVEKGSLKLRIMAEMINGDGFHNQWREHYCDIHEKEMINILERACSTLDLNESDVQ